MNLFKFPPKENWSTILARPVFEQTSLQESVGNMLNEVKTNGDKALIDFTSRFDSVDLSVLQASDEEIVTAINNIPVELQKAIKQAKQNIEKFHNYQVNTMPIVRTMPGVECWQKSVAIEKVGLYIPGGTAPLFSTVLMLAIPAQIAGCKEIVLCTPPQKDGTINPVILYAAQLVGITKVFKVGGAQAIAAMAYGTESVPAVNKIFGPGNQFVTAAKQLVNKEGIPIDMPAGPSEVLVLADDTAKPSFVAADLLSQAEHGIDSQVVLITFDEKIVEQIKKCIEQQLEELPRKAIAEKALENSIVILVKDDGEAIDIINDYAPEHLIIAAKNTASYVEKITNAGSVFLGNFTPESVGDYASGTNHTLPTNGFAKSYSGVNLDAFVKKITYQQLSEEGIQNIGNTVALMAEAELLEAHKKAVTIRLDYLKEKNIEVPENEFDLEGFVRPNIQKMLPYSSARNEFKGTAEIFLDANENPFDNGLNRYPDPLQKILKNKIAQLKNISFENIFLGNGSDEVIDLLIRIFCEPRLDNIVILPPTYGMYKVSAALSDIEVKEAPLMTNFQPDLQAIKEVSTVRSKILFICSPNNPTGNSIEIEKIKVIARTFKGIVVIDEAYIDFANQVSCIGLLSELPNIVIAQTFSKAWGLAGIRLGMAFASTAIIDLLNKVKPPYNVNQLTQESALKALANKTQMTSTVNTILEERYKLRSALEQLDFIHKIYPSDANFLLLKMNEPKAVYNYLLEQKIVVRDRSKVLLCEGCLRFTIGTHEENQQLINSLTSFQNNRTYAKNIISG